MQAAVPHGVEHLREGFNNDRSQLRKGRLAHSKLSNPPQEDTSFAALREEEKPTKSMSSIKDYKCPDPPASISVKATQVEGRNLRGRMSIEIIYCDEIWGGESPIPLGFES